MIEDLLVPLITTSIAELGDKTQLSVLLLSSKTNKHTQLLLGVVLAFLVVDGLAVLVGTLIVNAVSTDLLKKASGIIFIIFGAVTLILKEGEKPTKLRFENPALSGFVLISLAELGDKTQITTALFATQFNALLVLVGTMIALTLLSMIAIFVGKVISSRFDRKKIRKAAGVVFIVMGIAFLIL